MRRRAAESPSVTFLCSGCGRPVRRAAGAEGVCATCGLKRAGTPALDDQAGPGRPLDRCLHCGLDRLYVQKDFNRKSGLWIFVVAAILSVPTWGLSLLAATLLDRALYHLLGDVTLCYGCGAAHRGFPRNHAHGEFDLHVAESVERGRAQTA